MVALRSRRLETLLGASLDALGYQHLEGLVTEQVSEAFDLDFKKELYGNGEKGRHDLATDVAALANTAGGLVVLGIEEDEQARAVAAPGVTVSDAELRRILSVVGSRVVPLPVFEPLPVRKPGEDGRGFIVVAVARSPLAPHAVIVNEGLRYPRRNGTTTRYLSEPEVASAYRERLASTQRQAERIQEVEGEALQRLDISSDMPWVVVSLVPDLPGELSINSEVLNTFRRGIEGQPVAVVAPLTGARFYRASVGRRRLLADGAPEGSLAKWLSLELHTDGSGVFGLSVPNLTLQPRLAPPQGDEPLERWVQDEGLVIAVMSGLLLLAQHARDRAAAGGSALIRAQIFPISEGQPTRLAQTRPFGMPDTLGDRVLTMPPPPAEAAAELDDLAQAGPMLAAATALLVDDIGQAFGVPEMSQLTHDGQLRRPYWGDPQIITWTEEHRIEVIDG
jgi:hypothetical protein